MGGVHFPLKGFSHWLSSARVLVLPILLCFEALLIIGTLSLTGSSWSEDSETESSLAAAI